MTSLLDLACQEAWAIDQRDDNSWLRKILEIADRTNLEPEAVEARLGAPLENTRTVTTRNGVAVIPVTGPIFRRANLFTRVSGATSIEVLATDLREAMDAPRDKVGAVLLNFDTPGGTVNGTNEFAKMVAQARAAGEKPIAAYVGFLAASGGYWIASAVGRDALFVDETAMLGSIGVVIGGVDTRERDQARGVREFRFVSSQSPNKRIDPLSEDGAAVLQAKVDRLAERFIEVVAENRGTTPEDVINNFGQGDTLLGPDAVAAGMADGVSSFEEVLAGLAADAFKGPGGRVFQIPNRSEPVMSEMTSQDLAVKYPKAAEELRAEARKEGFEAGKAKGIEEGREQGHLEGRNAGAETGKAEGLIEGAASERQRIFSLEAAALPGFEAELKACKEDGKSTAADLAQKIVASQQAKGEEYLARLAEDKKALEKKGSAPDPTGGASGGGDAKHDARALASEAQELIAKEAAAGRTLSADEAVQRIVKGKAA